MKKSLFLLSVIVALVAGCTFLPQPPDISKITGSKVENPFFKIPPENLKDFQDRAWILLIESSTKNWFYDPYSLVEDEDRVVIFDAYIASSEKSNLDRFNATIIGPYRQKIDCFGNHQWSEIFYAENLPPSLAMTQANDPTKEYGWIKIRPKTAMAFMRSRICGRKFIDEKNVNFFLYQDGLAKTEKQKNDDPIVQASDALAPITSSYPTFFEVINNEVVVLDAKKDIREMRISSYVFDKDFPKKGDFTFTANCQANTFSVQVQGKGNIIRGAIDPKGNQESKESLSAVAFNRACGDHGAYMKAVSRSGK